MIRLGANDIHVWRFDRELAGEAALRSACIPYLGNAFEVNRSPLGKPFLPGAPLEVAVAHTRGVTVVAVAREVLGVDVEQVDPLPDLHSLRAHTLTPRENQAIEFSPLPEREALFYRCWVRKEALLKARGCGLSVDPREVDTTSAVPGWHWIDGKLEGNIAIAIATVEPHARVSWIS